MSQRLSFVTWLSLTLYNQDNPHHLQIRLGKFPLTLVCNTISVPISLQAMNEYHTNPHASVHRNTWIVSGVDHKWRPLMVQLNCHGPTHYSVFQCHTLDRSKLFVQYHHGTQKQSIQGGIHLRIELSLMRNTVEGRESLQHDTRNFN